MPSTNAEATKAEVKEELDGPQLSGLEKFRKFVTPNRHTKIESFGRRVIILGGTFGLMMTTAGVLTYQHSQEHLSQQAVYTTSFKTSKTDQPGKIDGVYSNKDRTRVLVMMHFDDSARMSAIAANYRTFLAGATESGKPDSIKTHPSGSIIMFGQGYMGLYLTSANGFHNQIMSAIMRADKQLVSTTDAGSDTDQVDPRKSFQTYDQWEVFFNPAGKNSTHIASLDQNKLDMGQIYYDTVLKSQEADQKKQLNDDLVKLKADLSSIQDYRTRLSTTSINGLRVKVPDDPEMVAGDTITGHDASPGVASTLMLHPKKTFDNGFNFDWRNTTIEKGVLNTVVPKGQNYVTWFNNHTAKTPQSDPSASLKWTLTDGTDLSSVSTSDVVSFQNLNTMVQSLTSSYSDYYNDKQQYQSTDLGKYLSLEMQLKDVVQNNNINSSKKAINFYG